LAIPFGFLGLHHFYLEKPRLGMVYLFTGGLFGIGWLIDIFRMPLLVAMTNKKLEECARRTNEVSQRVGDNRDCIIVTDTSKVAAYPVNCQPQGKLRAELSVSFY
jgi:hypothetical protein